jgi:secreted PhoX family phosphatase
MSPALPVPTPELTRRRLLQGSGATAAAAFVGALTALQTRNAQAAVGGKQSTSAVSPYGPIAPVNDLATGLPLLQLPDGFAYASYGWTGDPMSNSQPTPGLHDGMAVVRSRRIGRSTELTLVRNHERGLVPTAAEAINAPANYATGYVNGIITLTGAITARIGANSVVRLPGQPDPPPFTGFAAGGTTNLVFRDGRWAGSAPSLGGTLGNCAGGPTPWGSWLSCEETVFDFSLIGGKKHGYVFECGADPTQSIASPIVEMGRFVHEAVAVDPASGHVYMTEDNRNCSTFFRYVPADPSGGLGSLQRGGRLQAARIKTILTQAVPQNLVNSNNTALLDPRIGDEYELEWVDIADPDADPRTVAAQPGGVSLGVMAGPTIQALAAGCSRWSRGEGIWYAAGKMFIVDTAAGVNSGGSIGNGDGAVWELTLATMRLRALFVSGNQTAGNNPDNVTVSPRGGVLLCEDGGGSTDAFGTGSRLLGLNSAGEAYIFVKNNCQLSAAQVAAAGKLVAPGDFRGIEFAGACFDPTGRVLFVSIQTPGITFAITGPWARGNL